MKPSIASRLALIPLVLAGALAPHRVLAFHAGQTFADPPGAGGGGGLFYLGTPKERGWDCTMCHEAPRGKLRLRLVSDPPELFERFEYVPGLRYAITATMEIDGGGDELGVGSPGNVNSMSAAFEDEAGAASGLATGVADQWTVTNGATLTSKGTTVGQRSFVFSWFAPEASVAAPTTLYIGLVDGNGGGASDTFQDPLGDDVFMAQLAFSPASGGTSPAGTSARAHRVDARAAAPDDGAPAPHESAPPWIAGASVILILGFLQSRKKRAE